MDIWGQALEAQVAYRIERMQDAARTDRPRGAGRDGGIATPALRTPGRVGAARLRAARTGAARLVAGTAPSRRQRPLPGSRAWPAAR
jgi:hypothetical protein